MNNQGQWAASTGIRGPRAEGNQGGKNENFIHSINWANFMTGLSIPVDFTVTWDQVSLFVNYQK